jgi:hypothetical protein
MTQEYHGSFIHIHFDANELSDGRTNIQLADGYTYERIYIHYIDNVELSIYMPLECGEDITFPVVNSKSPSILPLLIKDVSRIADIRLSIEKFGQIPDPNYFNGTFNPILVTGDDGNEYPVISSDQFK